MRLDLGSSKSADNATSGRYDLIKGGVGLFADAPLAGYGSGAFSREYRRARARRAKRATSASHTIPVTVAAEQGSSGLLVYLALLARGVRAAAARGARLVRARRSRRRSSRCVVHTMMYAAFLEDPLTWALLGVGVALATGASRRTRPEPRAPAAA